MLSMVTAIIAAGRNQTIDYNDGQACDVVSKAFTCIKTAWNNMFATVLTTITTIWRPGYSLYFMLCQSSLSSTVKSFLCKDKLWFDESISVIFSMENT